MREAIEHASSGMPAVTTALTTTALGAASYLGLISGWATLVSLIIGIIVGLSIITVNALKAHEIWVRLRSYKEHDE
jgi:uncharacterized membrane protein (Fun14 family)